MDSTRDFIAMNLSGRPLRREMSDVILAIVDECGVSMRLMAMRRNPCMCWANGNAGQFFFF
jgi:hypothetical protein